MKILIICNSVTGLETFRGMLIDNLIKAGNFLTIIVPFSDLENDTLTEKRFIALGCDLFRFPMQRRGINPFHDFKLIRDYYKTLKSDNPDLVITYTIKPNVYGGMACRRLNIPYVANITGLGTTFQGNGFLRKFVVLLYKMALKNAKTIFFENEENMQIFLNEKICIKNQAYLLNGAGVNLDHFSPKEYPTDDKEIRFLFIGRVMKEKGIDELFSAMQMLIDNGVNCSLDVVGGFEENYKEKIDQYTDAGWLRYHGYQSDVRPFIKNCHCFVLPSYHEGMANTNLECAASARPVITSNIHGCKEAVIDGVSGYLCERRDTQSLYNTMKCFSLLTLDEKRQLGLNGRKQMEDNFNKIEVVEKTIKNL